MLSHHTANRDGINIASYVLHIPTSRSEIHRTLL